MGTVRFSLNAGGLLVALLLGFPQARCLAADDATPPTGTIVINGNRSITNSPDVTLSLAWSDGAGSGVSRMRFSDNGATWSPWEAPMTTRAHTLPAGADGHRTVRVQFLDRANNRSAVYSDYIRLDTTPPTGTITINGGAAVTPTRAVTLGLTWSDGAGTGVKRMRFSDNGSTWTPWMLPAAARAHTLSSGPDGYRTVRVQYLDGAGNYSAVFKDYIRLDDPDAVMVLLPGNVPLELVRIPAGSFQMGSPETERSRGNNEGPVHTVNIGYDFFMGKYEVTQGQWQAVMGTNPGGYAWDYGSDSDYPAYNVSWEDAQAFITAVNTHILETGQGPVTLRLPSESEWEYACRAGTQTRFHFGDSLDVGDLCEDDGVRSRHMWYCGNSAGYGEPGWGCAPVGGKLPNLFGLHDMHGNLYEWCEDWCHEDYTSAPVDGSAWLSPSASSRIIRGGYWDYNAENCRSAYRGCYGPSIRLYYIGFRLAAAG